MLGLSVVYFIYWLNFVTAHHVQNFFGFNRVEQLISAKYTFRTAGKTLGSI
jgi:hypothetical protein